MRAAAAVLEEGPPRSSARGTIHPGQLAYPAGISPDRRRTDDAREARRQALTGALATIRLRSGRPGLIPTPEEAEAHVFTERETAVLGGRLDNALYGTADEVTAGLDDLCKRTGADELMPAMNSHGPDFRVRSYELVSGAYGLPDGASEGG